MKKSAGGFYIFIPEFVDTAAANRALHSAVATLDAMIKGGVGAQDSHTLIELHDQQNALLEIIKALNTK